MRNVLLAKKTVFKTLQIKYLYLVHSMVPSRGSLITEDNDISTILLIHSAKYVSNLNHVLGNL